MLEQQSYLNINTATQEQEFTVSQVSEALKRTLEEKFGSVRVRGEVSGLKVATSGHMYLSLKDDKAVLGAACWAGIASRLPFKVEEGMEVVCTGKISAYAARSNYQLIIEKMEIAGVGALLAMLEKRRKLLEAEGLFALERKRKLPFLPTVIGVVTSPTGAVIKDILHRLSDRFPVHVVIWPVLVQGNGAAEQIAKAIEGFNSLPRNLPQPDVLIVARGGGSIEDLWAFNEEIVVRAAAGSRIPLISAVGHETDTTLIDFASDRRAPTPTAAAEIAVPVREDLIVAIETYSGRMGSAISSKLKNSESMVLRLNAGLMRFTNNLQSLEHRISQIGIRLTYGLRRQLDQKVQRFELLLSKLSLKPFLQENEKKLMQLEALSQQLENSMVNILKHMETRVGNFSRLLDSFNYTKVLERGYTMIWGSDNKPLTRASQVQPDQEIQIEFADGRVKARKVS